MREARIRTSGGSEVVEELGPNACVEIVGIHVRKILVVALASEDVQRLGRSIENHGMACAKKKSGHGRKNWSGDRTHQIAREWFDGHATGRQWGACLE